MIMNYRIKISPEIGRFIAYHLSIVIILIGKLVSSRRSKITRSNGLSCTCITNADRSRLYRLGH